MSNIQPSFEQENGSILIPMHTSQPANEERGKCWERDFSEEFPISSVDNKDNEATIIIGAPHLDYKITTHLKDQKMDGESKLLSDKDVLVAKLTFVDGIANGPCTLYDENGALFFEGSFVNGYRQGKGKEYENDIVVHEGLYEKGKKLVKMTEMDGYWKEYDNSKNLHSVCKKDEEGRNDGVCFFYKNGEISRLSEWREGKETPFNGHFRLYDETNRKWIEGEYKDGVRNGESREYDENGKMVFEGYYENGKKSNMARLDEMPGYWKEYDENGNLKSICKKDKYGRYEGECHFYENGTVIKTSEWHEGIEISLSTSSKSSDEPQPVLNEEVNNSELPDGNSTEYDVSDSKQFEGPNNNRNRFIPLKYMKGYWEELDNKGKIVRICQIDAEGKYNGLSYQYRENQIIRVSRWEKDKEIEPLKSFHNGIMTEYKDGKKCYSGGYIPSLKSNYPRQGEGEEFDIDGETLIYMGDFIKGKRDGHGKLFKHSMAVYDGEWKKGMKKIYYYLYLILTLVFMLLTSVASFIFFNAYVGAIVSGLYITAICFYYNQYAGYIASGLFLVMCCFFVNLYAGIVVSLVIIITVSFYYNLFAGFVPTGLVVAAICMYLNAYLGIFAIGLFLIYLIFLVVYCCGWKKSIIWSNAIYILSLCTIVTLLLICNRTDLMKYVIVYGTGILLILILSLIVGSKDDKLNPLITSAIIILVSCTIISLFIQTVQPSYTKYVVISLFGLLLICIANLIVFELDWSTTVVLKCAAAIVVCCIIANTAIGSFTVPALKYVSVFASGLLLIIIISYFTGYNKENMHILLSSSGLIITCCILISLLLSSLDMSWMKYYIVFLTGLILFFLIYVIVSLCRADTVIALVSLGIILVLCTQTDLIIAAFEFYVMRFVAVSFTGILLMLILSFFTGFKKENMHILISSCGLIILACIYASLFLSSLTLESMKFFLVFLIGFTLIILIYFVTSLCRGDMVIVLVSLGIILAICTGTDLIMAAFEIYIFRQISVVYIGIMLIVLASLIIGCDSENTHILISTYGLIILSSILASLLLSGISLLSLRYYFVFLIGLIIFFPHYFAKSICEGDMVDEFKFFCTDMAICGIIDLIMAAFERKLIGYVGVIIFGIIMFFLLLVFTECGQLNPHALLSGSGLIISVCYLLCWLLGYRGIIFMNYILVFVIWLMLFSSVSYLNFKFIGDMRIVKGAFHYSIVCLIAAELYLGSVVNMTMRIISIYIAGIYIAWVLTTCKDFNFKWYTKIFGIIVGIFMSSVVALLFGAYENQVVRLICLVTGLPSVPIMLIIFCSYWCIYLWEDTCCPHRNER